MVDDSNRIARNARHKSNTRAKRLRCLLFRFATHRGSKTDKRDAQTAMRLKRPPRRSAVCAERDIRDINARVYRQSQT